MITKKAESKLLNVIKKMEKGDCIEFDGLTFYIFNSFNCLIDSINCYEN